MNETYRDNGAIGAILDEYERSVKELKAVIQSISANDLVKIVDAETEDEDCRSIQTILTHVVSAGYNYVVEVRKSLGEDLAYIEKEVLQSITDYNVALDQMFDFNVALFDDYPDINLEEYDPSKKLKVRWGQVYDVEQILEHAIVHVLRHRRQIERFKLRME